MRAADALIDEIVASSGIPSGKRRREAARELRSHVEDLVLFARSAGHADDEIERMVLERFGDPRQMARNFAWVYRRERAVLALTVFTLSTVAVATVIAAAVLAAQAGLAIGFGIPLPRVLASRHTVIEAIDILATVAAYTGFLSLEHLFDRRAFQKTIALLSIIFVLLIGASMLAGGLRPFLIFGFVNAIFLRSVREYLCDWRARLAVVVACFLLFGITLFWVRSAGSPSVVFAGLASWMVMGAGYQLMTGIAARVDRGLLNGLRPR